jgi:hypothetical protein
VVATATGGPSLRGVTVIINSATATSPIVPVAIANVRVDRGGSVWRIVARSAAASSDG